MVRSRTNDDNISRCLFGRRLGYHDADIITWMFYGNMRLNDSWKYSHARDSSENEVDLKDTTSKMWTANYKVQGCRNRECGISVDLGRKHAVECRQIFHTTRASDSLWTVRLDTDGKSLKITDVNEAGDTSDGYCEEGAYQSEWRLGDQRS